MTVTEAWALAAAVATGGMVLLRVEILSPRLQPAYSTNRPTRRLLDLTACGAWWWAYEIAQGSEVRPEHALFLSLCAITSTAQVVSIVAHSWRAAFADRKAQAHREDVEAVRAEVQTVVPRVEEVTRQAATEAVVQALGRFDQPPADY